MCRSVCTCRNCSCRTTRTIDVNCDRRVCCCSANIESCWREVAYREIHLQVADNVTARASHTSRRTNCQRVRASRDIAARKRERAFDGQIRRRIESNRRTVCGIDCEILNLSKSVVDVEILRRRSAAIAELESAARNDLCSTTDDLQVSA